MRLALLSTPRDPVTYCQTLLDCDWLTLRRLHWLLWTHWSSASFPRTLLVCFQNGGFHERNWKKKKKACKDVLLLTYRDISQQPIIYLEQKQRYCVRNCAEVYHNFFYFFLRVHDFLWLHYHGQKFWNMSVTCVCWSQRSRGLFASRACRRMCHFWFSSRNGIISNGSVAQANIHFWNKLRSWRVRNARADACFCRSQSASSFCSCDLQLHTTVRQKVYSHFRGPLKKSISNSSLPSRKK